PAFTLLQPAIPEAVNIGVVQPEDRVPRGEIRIAHPGRSVCAIRVLLQPADPEVDLAVRCALEESHRGPTPEMGWGGDPAAAEACVEGIDSREFLGEEGWPVIEHGVADDRGAGIDVRCAFRSIEGIARSGWFAEDNWQFLPCGIGVVPVRKR